MTLSSFDSAANLPADFKSGFTIYAKALLIFSLALLLLFGALFFLTEGVILSQFSEVEQQQTLEEVRQVAYLFEQENVALASIAADWAEWDEVYAFVCGNSPDFPKLNLNAESIENLRVDFLGIWNEQDQLQALVGQNSDPLPPGFGDEILAELQTEKLFTSPQSEQGANGMIMLDRQIASVAVNSITDSSRTQPPRGFLVVGRIWNPGRLSAMLPPGSGTLSVLHLGRALSDPTWREATIRLLASGEPVVLAPNEDFILGLMLLRTPEGTPLAAMVLQQDRKLFRIANRSARIFLLAMTAAGGSVIILLWLVIDRNILRRVGQIDQAVRAFRTLGEFPAGLDIERRDELGHLARGIQDLAFSLQESERALRDLSVRLLQLQDEERRRIARELHDSTAQNLSALEMNLSLLQKAQDFTAPSYRNLVSNSREIAEACSREIRTISYLLHPPLLDEVGLVFAIRWFVEGFVTRTGIRVTLNLPEDFPRLAPELETSLFRIVQEGLTNIYRHSGSSTAEVTLRVDSALIYLEIRDAGHGFKNLPFSSVPRPGLGLMGMQERVRQLRGKFTLDSDATGTRVQVSFPVSEALRPPPPSISDDALLRDDLDSPASPSAASAP